MGRKIVITGRGGTGKSTLAALAARFLAGSKLLVDADPDQSLAAMLGVDPAAEGVRSISEALYEVQARKAGREVEAMPLAQKVEYLLNLSCLYESAAFDMITLGVKWTRGCYCAPNDTLRALLPRLAGSYDFTIIDSPAGLEHVNRRVIADIDDLIALVDPSAKSTRNTEALMAIAGQIGLRFENLYLVANCRFGPDAERRLAESPGAVYVGRVEHDPAVQEFEAAGRSLCELPEDSPACVAARAVFEKMGLLDGRQG